MDGFGAWTLWFRTVTGDNPLSDNERPASVAPSVKVVKVL